MRLSRRLETLKMTIPGLNQISWSVYGLLKICSKERKITVEGNHEYRETDDINSIQSFLKFHTLWVTLLFNEDD